MTTVELQSIPAAAAKGDNAFFECGQFTFQLSEGYYVCKVSVSPSEIKFRKYSAEDILNGVRRVTIVIDSDLHLQRLLVSAVEQGTIPPYILELYIQGDILDFTVDIPAMTPEEFIELEYVPLIPGQGFNTKKSGRISLTLKEGEFFGELSEQEELEEQEDTEVTLRPSKTSISPTPENTPRPTAPRRLRRIK